MELANKITIGGINKVRKGFKGVTERKHVARIIGIARTADLKPSENMADSYKFGGEFRAYNSDGEEFASAVCYMPDPAQSLLATAVENDKTGAGVQFGFDFYIVPREDVPMGYSYEIKPLMEAKPSDALAALAQTMPTLPALAAPKAEGEATHSEKKSSKAK